MSVLVHLGSFVVRELLESVSSGRALHFYSMNPAACTCVAGAGGDPLRKYVEVTAQFDTHWDFEASKQALTLWWHRRRLLVCQAN